MTKYIIEPTKNGKNILNAFLNNVFLFNCPNV